MLEFAYTNEIIKAVVTVGVTVLLKFLLGKIKFPSKNIIMLYILAFSVLSLILFKEKWIWYIIVFSGLWLVIDIVKFSFAKVEENRNLNAIQLHNIELEKKRIDSLRNYAKLKFSQLNQFQKDTLCYIVLCTERPTSELKFIVRNGVANFIYFCAVKDLLNTLSIQDDSDLAYSNDYLDWRESCIVCLDQYFYDEVIEYIKSNNLDKEYIKSKVDNHFIRQ